MGHKMEEHNHAALKRKIRHLVSSMLLLHMRKKIESLLMIEVIKIAYTFQNSVLLVINPFSGPVALTKSY